MFRCTPSRLMLLLAVSALAGCDCGKTEPTCNDATLAFTLPDEGATVPGTFDAAITATVNGEPFAFDAATLTVQGHTFTGAVSSGAASFSGVTATAGSAELTASIAAGSCSKSVTRTVTVREETCTAPTVLGVSFPQDTTAPLGVLNAAELPAGTSLQVRVEAGCVSGVQVRIKRGVTVVGDLTDFVNGVATLTLPTLPDADSAQYDLFAELVRDGVAVNQPVGAALGSIRVQRGSPSCALTTTGVVGPAQDAQPSVTGFQARVSGTMAADSTGTLAVVNVGDAPVTPNAEGDVSADFTLPAATASYVLRLTCVDSAGNTTTANGTLQTDFDAPTVTILSPANNATVTASPLTLDVSVGQGEAGGLVQVLVNGQSVDVVTVDSTGVVHPTASFSADGTYTLTVRATDLAGNVMDATVTVTVQLAGCGIAFTRPAASPALLTPAQLQSGNYSFQTTSKPECAGQTATLFRAAVQADGGVAAEQQVGTATLTAGGLAAFAPLMMSDGAYRFRGSVTSADAGVSSATISVTVDLDGPAITNPVVPTGQSFATLSSAQDTQPGTPGVQRTLDYSATVPVGARVDVCTTQGIDPVSGSQRPTSAECGSSWFVLQQGVARPASAFTFPEGSYSIKIVVVGSGVSPAPESAAVGILSDGTRPCVQANTITLPQDTNGDGRLNIAELNGAPPALVFTPGCGDTAATLSATAAVTVRDLTAGAPGATRAATAVYAGGQYTVTLTGAYASEVDLNLFLQLTDLAFNQNSYAGAGDPAAIAFRVDPVAPVCSIASPSAAVLGLAQVPGGALDVTVNTSVDVTSGVHLTFTGQSARDVVAQQGTVTTQYTGLSGDSTVTIAASCTDASGNASTAPPVVTRIDLSAPTCGFTAPADGTTVTANEVQTTVALTGVADGAVVIVTSSLSGIASNQLTVTGGAATRLVRYPKGTQTVTATLADEAGNECVAPTGGHKAITLTVNNASCSLDFAASGPINTNTNGSWLNRVGAGLPVSGATPASASVAVGAVTSDCGAGRNVYLYAGAASATPSGTPQVTDASGAVTFAAQAFTEGGEYTVTIDDGTGLLTHRSFLVSLKAPTISALGLQRSASNTAVIPVAKDAALTFGAFTGNQRVATALATDMVFGDLNSSVDGADLSLTLSVIDGARVTPFDAKLEVLGVMSPVSSAITTDGGNQSLSLKLPHQVGTSTVNLVIRVTSPAGNTYTSTHTSQVDVVAPAALTVSQNLVNARNASVNLSWVAVNDDGNSSASGAAKYDVRWTTQTVIATGIADEATFFNTSLVKSEGVIDWSPTSPTTTLHVPPINTYSILVRPVDEVGNYSSFGAPASLVNRASEDVLLNPTGTGSERFGAVMAGPDLRVGPDAGALGIGYGFGPGTGSVNADGVDDFVVGAPNRTVIADGGVLPDGGVVTAGSVMTLAGAVYVYFGGGSFSSSVCSLPDCQTIVPYQVQASSLFGGEVSLGNVDEPNTTPNARLDLLVSSIGYDASRGRVFMYFGSPTNASLDTNAFIEFRGQDYGSRLGSVAKVLPDMNGDGYNEVLLAARGEPVIGTNAGQGMLYLFFGRSRANWQALMTATDGVTTRPYVPVSAATADRVLQGPLPVDTLSTVSNLFAATRGVASTLGDLTGDGVPDFVIAANKNNLNVAYLYSGASVVAATAPIPVPSLQINELDKGTTGVSNGFGTRVVGGQSILSTGAPDLIATQARPAGGTPAVVAACNVKVFTNGSSSGYGSPITITGDTTRAFGTWAEVVDVNGDGLRDLLVGEGGANATAAWVFFQRSDRSFDTGAGAGFWQSNFRGPTSSRRGVSAAYGDFSGDGFVDLAIGDDIDGAGRVIVWH